MQRPRVSRRRASAEPAEGSSGQASGEARDKPAAADDAIPAKRATAAEQAADAAFADASAGPNLADEVADMVRAARGIRRRRRFYRSCKAESFEQRRTTQKSKGGERISRLSTSKPKKKGKKQRTNHRHGHPSWRWR